MNVKYPSPPPALPPAVVVHGLAEGRAAAALGYPVTLLSAEGAVMFAGALWWRHLVAAVRTACHDTPVADVLDCADAPGLALAALGCGQRLIRLAPGPAWELVATRAAVRGATVLAVRPPALDLAGRRAAAQLPVWLTGTAGQT